MGQYDFSAQRVQQAATQLLSTSRLKHPPPWYSVLHDVPPPQLLVRPAFRAGEYVSEKRSRLPTRLKKGKRPSRMFQPVTIPRGPEHELRATFFTHHPWELARPRVVLEDDGRDAQKWDWSKGIKQPGKPLDGESAVQRQLYFRNLKSPHAFANAYTQDQAEHTVIVSNLSEETNADDVRAFFAECGILQGVEVYGHREAALEPLTETTANESDPQFTRNFEPNLGSTIASIRFSTLEQALAAVQKSGSSIKPSTPPIHVRRLVHRPHTLFITGLPSHVTENSTLMQAFSSFGTVSHPHIIHTETAPHSPTGCGFITFQSPAQAATAKERFATHLRVRLYDFPLTKDMCYDLARKEFYAHRHYADVERKVAQEEALSTGAYFTSSPNQISMQLEDQKYEDWKAWAIQEVEKARQTRDSGVTDLNNEEPMLEGAEIEEGAQDVSNSIPGSKGGQTALGGAAMRP